MHVCINLVVFPNIISFFLPNLCLISLLVFPNLHITYLMIHLLLSFKHNELPNFKMLKLAHVTTCICSYT